MPLSYEILDDKRLVIATISGVITADEIYIYQNDVWKRPEVADYDEIVDMSAVEKIDYRSGREVRELAEYAGRMDSRSRMTRLAIVAPSQESFGIGRMYQTYREMAPGTKEARVFRTMDEARAWLSGL